MSLNRNSLILQRGEYEHNPEVKDLVTDFGFVCLEGETFPMVQTFKTPHTQTWLDEDGEDVYAGGSLYVEPFDVEIPIGIDGKLYKGQTSQVKEKLRKLISWLAPSDLIGDEHETTKFSFYVNKYGKGYHGCYIKSVTDVEYKIMGETYELLTAKLTIRVPNPRRTTALANGELNVFNLL